MFRSLAVAAAAGLTSAAPIFNQSAALEYAYLATAAYCGYPKTSQASLEAWQCGPACQQVPDVTNVRQIITSDDNDAYAYVARFRGQCFVAFRGTTNLQGWMQDLKSLDLVKLSDYGVPCSFNGTDCLVGDGFVSNYFSIGTWVQGNLSAIGCAPGESVVVTGHSLGGAEAVIAAFDLQAQGYQIKEVYTFGQPRVGDAAFAFAFDAGVHLNSALRVTYRKDPVPHLPELSSGFLHIGAEVFYDADVSSGYVLCDVAGEDPQCSDKYTDVTFITLACIFGGSECDHLHYMTSLDQLPMDGSSCVDGTALVV